MDQTLFADVGAVAGFFSRPVKTTGIRAANVSRAAAADKAVILF